MTIKKSDLEKRLDRLEDSIGYDGKVYIYNISMDVGEAINLLAQQLGTDIAITNKK